MTIPKNIQQDNCQHDFIVLVFTSWSPDFLGLECKKCEFFITEDDLADYVNELIKNKFEALVEL